jgi:ABC-type sugar transport system substrate-binding protein
MSRFKKISIGLLVIIPLVIATVVFAGSKKEGEATKVEAPDEIIDISYLITDATSHPFWIAQIDALKDYAKELGVNITINDAANNSSTQTSQVETAILKEPDAVMYTAVDSGIGVSHIASMKEAGIPVLNNNRPIKGANYDVSFIFDEIDGGKLAAELCIDFLEDKYGEPRGKILELQGALTDENAILRTQGIYSVTDKYDDVEVITKNTNWDLVQAGAVALDAFEANPDIDAIYLQSDFLLPSILPIVEDKPKVGEEGHIFVVSLSGDPVALSLIRDGIVDVSINMDVIQMAKTSLELILKVLKGEEIMVGSFIGEGEPWGPCEVKSAPGDGVDIKMKMYPIDIKNVDAPGLWGNQYEL